jgi:N4-(beta-N-acetylglucosaminyl)-L-asparaginase
MSISRRDFLASAALATLAAGAEAQSQRKVDEKAAETKSAVTGMAKNVIICSLNGFDYLNRGYAKLIGGADTLDAAIAVVSGPEDDPNDDSVGLGGLPNEEGVVQLDSCLMHGPTRRAGSVGALENVRSAAAVARAVMEHTGHVMLVGDGASRFALEMGFPKENLLTERSRKIWLLWKEYNSNLDWWGPGLADPGWNPPAAEQMSEKDIPEPLRRLYNAAAALEIPADERWDAIHKVLIPQTGTINCSVVNAKGEMSSVTTTSGLSWKIPGRLGDSPIIGAGCYCDQDVGGAGATGSGEENIKIAGAHTIVENMRRGMSPEEAGMDALKRIVRNYEGHQEKLKYMNMKFYILRKDGAYAGVSLWSRSVNWPWESAKESIAQFAVHDGTARKEHCKYLFEGAGNDWPPFPKYPAAAAAGISSK